MSNKNIPSKWAKDSWNWAKNKKIVDGSNPKGNLTREQFAKIVYDINVKRILGDGK